MNHFYEKLFEIFYHDCGLALCLEETGLVHFPKFLLVLLVKVFVVRIRWGSILEGKSAHN